MARLPLIDPAATSGDMRTSFDRMPVVLNIFKMMAHAESNFIPAMRFANSILHRQKLSHVNRELLILQVARQIRRRRLQCRRKGAAGVRPGSHRERPRCRTGLRRNAPAFQRAGDRRIDPRDRVLHDDGPPDGSNRGRPRPGRRHDRLRGRQEAIGLIARSFFSQAVTLDCPMRLST